MLIYVPHSSFESCAEVFDDYTLRHQCINIVRLLIHLGRFKSQPSADTSPNVATMWRSCPGALAKYGMILTQEALNRGFNAPMLTIARYQTPCIEPVWLRWGPLLASHRAALILADERRLVLKAVRSYIHWDHTFRRRRTVTSMNPAGVTVAEWIAGEFGLDTRDLDSWGLEAIKRGLTTLRVPVRINYYLARGFQDDTRLPLAWPNYYVEELEIERPVRPPSVPQRNRPRGVANPVRNPDSILDGN